MNYKASKYNLIFERNNQTFLWNTFTDALIKLDKDDAQFIYDFGTTNNNTIEDWKFQNLIKCGCILSDSYDELGKVLFDEKSVMLNPFPNALHYTIAPGLACNYNCPYCFEKKRESNKSMDNKVQNDVCDFILNKICANSNVKNLGITWFGGEPLLNLEAIEYISKKLIDFCTEKGIIYSAGIVTNGRFLTNDVAQKLVDLKVKYVQLAVDGMSEQYTKMKGCSESDFYQVIKNIETCADIIPITVRINVSDSINEACKLTDFLLKTKKLDGKIKIYIAHIRDYEQRTGEEERKSHADFLKNEKTYMLKFGKNKDYKSESLSYIIPQRRCTTCLTVCSQNYCIGPEGELYRCEHFFGRKDKVVGTIYEGRYYTENEQNYLTFQHPQKCLDCQLFPICLGGCMNDVKNGSAQLSCEDFKEHLIDCTIRKYFDE